MGNITPVDMGAARELSELEVASALRAAAAWVRDAPADERCYGHLADDGGTLGLWPSDSRATRWCAFGRACYEAKAETLSTWCDDHNMNPQAVTSAFDRRNFATAAWELEQMAAFIEAGLPTTTINVGEMVIA